MLKLKAILARLGQSQSNLAAALGIHRSAAAQWLNHEHTPAGLDLDRLTEWLRLAGATPDDLATWGDTIPPQWADTRALATPPVGPHDDTPPAGSAGKGNGNLAQEIKAMLGRRESLSREARERWGLSRDPFIAEIESYADLYLTPEARRCREAVWQVCQHGGFVALVGESGSGKTVLVEDLEDRVRREAASIVLIRPYIIDLDQRAAGGRRETLTALDIGRRIIRVLDPQAAIKQDKQDRWAQIHQVLRAARASGKKPVLLIEEAHSLPGSTLRHLKRYIELKEGYTPLISVVLIGQNELGERLDRWDDSIREITQRCEVLHLRPLDEHVGDYLRHKFSRKGVALDQVLTRDAVEALKTSLTITPRGVRGAQPISLLYPLAVANLVTAAMNRAALGGFDVVEPDHVRAAL